jgi:cobalamin-dependent methionine synthase I
MARTAERKISIARRIRDLAVDRFGSRDEDLLFDPLGCRSARHRGRPPQRAGVGRSKARDGSQTSCRVPTVVGLSNVVIRPQTSGARRDETARSCTNLREAGLTARLFNTSKILAAKPDSEEAMDTPRST